MTTGSGLPALPTSPLQGMSQISGYITRNEKLGGYILTAAILGGLTFLVGPFILPSVVSTLGLINQSFSYLIAIMIKAGLMGLVGFIITRPRFWTIGAHLSHSIGKFISDIVIRMNPVERAQHYANEYLDAQRQKIHAKERKVRGIYDKLKKNVEDLTDRCEQIAAELRTLKVRHHNGQQWNSERNEDTFRRLSLEYDTKQGSLKRLQALLEVTDNRLKFLKKALRAYDYFIDSIRIIVDAVTAEYEMTKATAEAVRGIEEVVSGSSDQARFFQASMAVLASEIADFNAQIDQIMNYGSDMVANAELRGEVAEDKMMRLLSEGQSIDHRLDLALARAQESQTLVASRDTLRIEGKLHEVQERPLLSMGD